MKYKRILLKLSGEALSKGNGTGIEFDKVLEDYTKTINVPVSYNIYLNGNQIATTKGGFYHEKYPQILRQAQLDEPIMLIGPAGSGKNVAVAQVAESLGLKMYYTNNASNEFKLTGFTFLIIF